MTKVEFQITRDVYEGDLEKPVKIQVESSLLEFTLYVLLSLITNKRES